MLPILAINSLPCLLAAVTWWTQRNDRGKLPNWRRAIFVVALVANTTSSAWLLAFLLHTFSESHIAEAAFAGTVFFSMLAMGLISAALAVFGRRASRLLLVVNGLLLTSLWYMAGLASSV